MGASSAFTDDQKKAYVATAQKHGRNKAAASSGVSTTTISMWAKALGVDLRQGPSEPKKRTKKKRAAANGTATSNGTTNGHATPSARPVGPPDPPPLDQIHDQLTAALKTVEAMRAAYRQVFG